MSAHTYIASHSVFSQALFVTNRVGENQLRLHWLMACIVALCAQGRLHGLVWCDASVVCFFVSCFVTVAGLQVPCGHAQFCIKCCTQLLRCPLCRVPGAYTLVGPVYSFARHFFYASLTAFSQYKCFNKYTARVLLSLQNYMMPRGPSVRMKYSALSLLRHR
jgi:hypothetical protein